MSENKNFPEQLEQLTLQFKRRLNEATECHLARSTYLEFLQVTDELLSQMAQWTHTEIEILLQQIQQSNAREVAKIIQTIMDLERAFLYRLMEEKIGLHDFTNSTLIRISCTPRKHGWNEPTPIPRKRNLRVDSSHQKNEVSLAQREEAFIVNYSRGNRTEIGHPTVFSGPPHFPLA